MQKEGFPGAPSAMSRRVVRQVSLRAPLADGSLGHPLHRFGEHVECSAPGIHR